MRPLMATTAGSTTSTLSEDSRDLTASSCDGSLAALLPPKSFTFGFPSMGDEYPEVIDTFKFSLKLVLKPIACHNSRYWQAHFSIEYDTQQLSPGVDVQAGFGVRVAEDTASLIARPKETYLSFDHARKWPAEEHLDTTVPIMRHFTPVSALYIIGASRDRHQPAGPRSFYQFECPFRSAAPQWVDPKHPPSAPPCRRF